MLLSRRTYPYSCAKYGCRVGGPYLCNEPHYRVGIHNTKLVLWEFTTTNIKYTLLPQQYIQRSTMSVEVKVATLPKCDLCKNTALYDAKTKMGPWAYLCNRCFRRFGLFKLGIGYGQKLILEER